MPPITNGLFGVPWGIGGGTAILQAEVARFLAHHMLGGAEGVMGKDHFKPSQLGTPGAGILLQPGGCAMLNRTSGAGNQSYVDLASSAVTVNLDPTTGAGRTDLVLLRVEDPYVSGNSWSAPSDLQNGPYIYPRVVYGVSSSIKTVTELGNNWSAIPIARVTRPASTSTILDSHITDLRTLINAMTGGIQPAPAAVQEKSEFSDIKVGPVSPASLTPSSTSYADWPPECTWSVPVPSWATYLELTLEIKGCLLINGAFWGDIRPVIAGVNQSSVSIDKNQPSIGASTEEVWVGGEYYIQPSLRGTTITIKTQAKSNAEPGTLQSYQYTYSVARFKFKQTPGVA
jgi:hypothetical protein